MPSTPHWHESNGSIFVCCCVDFSWTQWRSLKSGWSPLQNRITANGYPPIITQWRDSFVGSPPFSLFNFFQTMQEYPLLLCTYIPTHKQSWGMDESGDANSLAPSRFSKVKIDTYQQYSSLLWNLFIFVKYPWLIVANFHYIQYLLSHFWRMYSLFLQIVILSTNLG